MYNLAQKTIDSIQKQGHTIYKQEILESITSKSLIWKDDNLERYCLIKIYFKTTNKHSILLSFFLFKAVEMSKLPTFLNM